MRCGSVSTPIISWKAACADSVGPKSRSCSLRSLVRKPNLPKFPYQDRLLYDGTGSVINGKLPLSQGNLPDSTTTPPIVVPWPPKNLVAEWITISAPCPSGRIRYGGGGVASHTNGSPC